MTLDAPFAAEPLSPRHERILALLNEGRMVEVARLAESLGVSAVTIRSDLDALERRRLLRRVRGGALAIRPARFERPDDLPSQHFTIEKERIGAVAAAMVRDGETVILDGGTTTLALAAALPRTLRDVAVVTSCLDIALALHGHPGVTVIVTGGTLRKNNGRGSVRSLTAPLGTLVLGQINADAAFLCCTGVDAVRGFTNSNWDEAELKKAMIAAAGRTVFVADHGKIGHVGGARIAGLDEASLLVTDSAAPGTAVQALEAAGLRVVLA